jgi:urocanate hydratase
MSVQETAMSFKEIIKQGIPSVLPAPKLYLVGANCAPKRKEILSVEEKQHAVRKARR